MGKIAQKRKRPFTDRMPMRLRRRSPQRKLVEANKTAGKCHDMEINSSRILFWERICIKWIPEENQQEKVHLTPSDTEVIDEKRLERCRFK